ncbi:hypothetical protein JL101_004700 [Skermanella rosea]|uniref:J domain-containing protein n=1 Tax=Skermanella rosea TaxID=1817965 RepID=UPI0019342497|nr:hypothetical protein [Skermanella rosea]UEM04745.1 hypothetical protein JL101_004700 [Skermanella rosea]
MLLVLLLGWVVFAYVFAALLHLLAFLLMCLCEALALLFRAVLWPLCKGLFRLLRSAFLILFYFADELRRGPEREDRTDEPAEPEFLDLYAQAAARLGLPPVFEAAELERAYRQAIRKAHPDAGGSVGDAQEINAARDLIVRARGWK